MVLKLHMKSVAFGFVADVDALYRESVETFESIRPISELLD